MLSTQMELEVMLKSKLHPALGTLKVSLSLVDISDVSLQMVLKPEKLSTIIAFKASFIEVDCINMLFQIALAGKTLVADLALDLLTFSLVYLQNVGCQTHSGTMLASANIALENLLLFLVDKVYVCLEIFH